MQQSISRCISASSKRITHKDWLKGQDEIKTAKELVEDSEKIRHKNALIIECLEKVEEQVNDYLQ